MIKNWSKSRFFYLYIGFLTVLFVAIAIYYAILHSPFGSAATLTVTNLNDSGAGSFREAVLTAFYGDVIAFDPSLSGGTITLLETLTIGKSITATAEGNITLTGPDIPNVDFRNGACIYIGGTPAANNVTISGFIIENCAGDGIKIDGLSSDNIIGGDTIAERNVIINNGNSGINFGGDDNIIKGNYIGLEADGITVNGNNSSGVIFSQGSNNIIGGLNDGEENYIVGNQYGISFSEPGEGDVISNNKIYGNIIGLTPDGTIGENTAAGMSIASDGNYIGDDLAGAGNIISGNSNSGIGRGVIISGDSNIVKANIIGLAEDGATVKANGSAGTHGPGIELTGNYNQIGSDNSLGINVISGNNGDGILLSGENNTIEGNIIGLSSDGTLAKGNIEAGIDFTGASTNIITGNTISANNEYGIGIGSNSDSNTVILNRIGIGLSTVVDLGNIGNGIEISISTGSNGNFIGVSEGAEMANIIAYNNRGISTDSGTIQNTVRFNSIFDNDNEGLNIGGISPSIVTRDTSILSVSVDGSFPNGSYVDFYYDDGSGEPETYINTGIVAGSSASIIGPFTVGNYVVVNVTDLLGNSTNVSSRAVIFSDNISPDAPSNLSANAGDGSVSLNWDDNSDLDLDDYNVYRSISSPVEKAVGNLIASGLIVSEYEDTEVTNGITYYYAISAIDISLNESDLSAEDSATPQDLIAPSAPTGLNVTVGDAQLILDWNDNGEGDFDHYNVYRAITTPVTKSVGNIIASDVLSSAYTDTGVVNDTTYYYAVTAFDTADNESDLSNEDSATPIDDTSPSAPANLLVTVGDSQLILNWDDNSEEDFDHYDIFRSTASGVETIAANRITTDLLTSVYTNTGLTNGVTYYYKIIAVDVNNNSSLASSEGSGTPLDTTAPSAPANLLITAGDSQLVLNWNDNSEEDFDHYDVYRSTITGFTPALGNRLVTSLTPSTYTDTGATNDVELFYKVIAYDETGNPSLASSEVAGTAQVAISAPTGFAVITEGDTKLTLNWNDNTEENFDHYQLYRSGNSGFEVLAATLLVNNLTVSQYVDENLINGTTYYYKLVAYDSEGNYSSVSDEIHGFPRAFTGSAGGATTVGTSGTAAGDSGTAAGDSGTAAGDSGTVAGDSGTESVISQPLSIPVQGIPINKSTAEASSVEGQSSSGLSDTLKSNVLINIEKNKVATEGTLEKNDICNLEYYGNEDAYENILEIYDLTEQEALYFDVDRDGLNAKEECKYKTNPLLADMDKDGLSDGEEISQFKTDPFIKDTDGDTYADGIEIKYNSDPLDFDDYPDVCELVELYNEDLDNDGLPNDIECEIGSDAENNDSDFDGMTDAEEYLDYNTNPTEADKEIKLGITFPFYDSIIATSKPFFQCVAPEGENVIIILQHEMNGKPYVLGEVTADERNKCLYNVESNLLDGEYFLTIETSTQKSLPVRFIIDTSFTLEAQFTADTLDGKKITEEILNGDKILSTINSTPDFVGKLEHGDSIDNRVNLIWHSVVSGAVAMKDASNHVSARPPRPLENGLHNLYVSLLDANGNQGAFIKIPFEVNKDNLLASFEGGYTPAGIILLFILVFTGVSYYIYFEHKHPHAIRLTSADIINHVSDHYHDKLLRKVSFRE